MERRPRRYLSYLLRMWRSGEGREATWQASLECPLSDTRHGFSSLKDLFAFLEALANPAGQGSEADEGLAEESGTIQEESSL